MSVYRQATDYSCQLTEVTRLALALVRVQFTLFRVDAVVLTKWTANPGA